MNLNFFAHVPSVRIGWFRRMSREHTKFQVSSFRRLGDIKGVPKFKSKSRDLGHAPFIP